jgi:3-hydroxyacyl-[acyl-carrier-protein] dehydratase
MSDNQLHIEDIIELIPHRYPFLLIDRVLEISDEKIVGIKNVTMNESFFQGHFPEKPVFPGVLLIEACAQLSGIYLYKIKGEYPNKYMGFLTGVSKFRFRKIIEPGDCITIESTMYANKLNIFKFNVVAKVDSNIAGEGLLDIKFSENVSER